MYDTLAVYTYLKWPFIIAAAFSLYRFIDSISKYIYLKISPSYHDQTFQELEDMLEAKGHKGPSYGLNALLFFIMLVFSIFGYLTTVGKNPFL
jgi:hypothetical protein